MDYREISDIRDGMRIDWDMPITMDDGLKLRCDIYRPIADCKYPVIMTLGPYGKWLHFDDGTSGSQGVSVTTPGGARAKRPHRRRQVRLSAG